MTSEAARGDADASPLTLLKPHWRLVLAAFLGWFLDAFDQVALLLVLPEIGKSFGVSLTTMGLVITAQSLGRIVGNTGWGWLADRKGRKLAFMVGVVWFAACSGATALAWSYAALVVIQFLFGMGFGGEWTASASLLMESVPARARSVASSFMMAGYEVGFFAAAGVQAVLLPTYGWRSLFLVGIAPAILAIFIRIGISESPVWLEAQRERERNGTRDAPRPPFRWTPAAVQACAFMALLQFQTASIYAFYPTLLKTAHGFDAHAVFLAVAAYSVGSVVGKLSCGALASRFGPRAVMLVCFMISTAVVVPFSAAASLPLVVPTAFVLGGSSSGVFALVPHYLSMRFANAVRSFGMGLAYALAALGQAVSSYLVPAAGHGIGLGHSIALFTIATSIGAAAIVAYRPRILPGRDMDERSSGSPPDDALVLAG